MTKADLMKAIVITAEYYGRTLSPMTIEAMAGDLEDVPIDTAILAYVTWRRSGKNRQMPMPAQIIAMIKGEPVSAHAIGVELASRAMNAVRLYGWNNEGTARHYIGEDGWAAIIRFGDWGYICQHLGTDVLPLTVFCAQARGIVESHVEFFDKGISLKSAPMIGDRREPDRGLVSVGKILEMIPE